MTLKLRNPTAGRKPFLPITEIEHAAFCKSEDELPAKPLLDEIKGQRPVAEDPSQVPPTGRRRT